jgi:hypothetical protein
MTEQFDKTICANCGHSKELHTSKKTDGVKWKNGLCTHPNCVISYVKKTSKCKKFVPKKAGKELIEDKI